MDEFELFPMLPKELRLMIWKTALFTPRVLGLSFGPADEALTDHGCPSWNMTRTTSLSLIRQVCHESRVESLNAETLELMPSCKGFHKSFRNQAVDIVFFLGGVQATPNPRNVLLSGLSRGLACKTSPIPRLALQADLMGQFFWGDTMPLQSIFRHLNNCGIEELIFVLGEDSMCRAPDVVLVKPMNFAADTMPQLVVSQVMAEFNITTPLELTWEHMEQSYLACHRGVHRQYIKARQELRDCGIDPDCVAWDAWYEDPAKWKFKRITFMEATTPAELQKRKRS
ncbi:hypothetical protein BKA61DRAFT_680907 [Leptodontidium sp. MPI-SDFR-AT-0119]|nr:hypothetical protein BKA61DRAFT_680907 [Leptodontidium sp. MPI-SDFR-AT-0119]